MNCNTIWGYPRRRNIMKIEVTNEAKNEISKVLSNEKNAGKLLRIYIAGYG